MVQSSRDGCYGPVFKSFQESDVPQLPRLPHVTRVYGQVFSQSETATDLNVKKFTSSTLVLAKSCGGCDSCESASNAP